MYTCQSQSLNSFHPLPPTPALFSWITITVSLKCFHWLDIPLKTPLPFPPQAPPSVASLHPSVPIMTNRHSSPSKATLHPLVGHYYCFFEFSACFVCWFCWSTSSRNLVRKSVVFALRLRVSLSVTFKPAQLTSLYEFAQSQNNALTAYHLA